MKKNVFLFLILFLSVSCKQDKPKPVVEEKVTTPIEVEKKAVINDSISGFINPKLSLYSFKFDLDTAHSKLNTIKIYCDGKLVQTINANKDVSSDNEFTLHDWNIDGYKDISVLDSRGATGNDSYWIWSYSPSKKKFVFNNELSETFVLFDSTEKYVIFHYRVGAECEFWDSCQYINHKLRTIRYFEQNYWIDQNGKYWVKHTRKKRVHGVLKETVDSCVIN